MLLFMHHIHEILQATSYVISLCHIIIACLEKAGDIVFDCVCVPMYLSMYLSIYLSVCLLDILRMDNQIFISCCKQTTFS